VHGLHAFLPCLLDQDRSAYIVNTASMAGLVAAAGFGAYSATKAAVVALTEALDVDSPVPRSACPRCALA
jgi:short-subunit dehydrogenase